MVAALLALTLFLRLHDLEADPPENLSESTSVYTDPPQYTLNARYFVEQGSFDPYGDHRYPFFLKSTVTLLAIGVFKLLGVGLWQSNFVGILYAFGAVVLFFLYLRRSAGRLAALIFLLTMSLNYNLIFHDRLPYLEHAMLFWSFLALVLLTYSIRPAGSFLAGVCLATGIFFGKIIGLIFVFPFAVYLLAAYWYLPRRQGGQSLIRPLLFAAGCAAVALAWVGSSYLTTPDEVTGYLGEQTVGLYGAPDGLSSVSGFFMSLASFGMSSHLFSRMPLVALAGAVFFIVLCTRLVGALTGPTGRVRPSAEELFLAAMIVAFYGALMIWNYRPLRYQIGLIYAFHGAAAWMVAGWWRQRQDLSIRKLPWYFCLPVWPVVFVVVMQLLDSLAQRSGFSFSLEGSKTEGAAVTTLIVVALWIVARRWHISEFKLPAGKLLALAVVLVSLIQGVYLYLDWRGRVTYTLKDNAADLNMILSDKAVLSGPYGPTFALIADRPTVIHMFGGARVDSTLFQRFPITHLLLDEANEQQARADYPALMDSAEHVCTYHVCTRKVRLYRIAAYSPNAAAAGYGLSAMELAAHLDKLGNRQRALRYAQAFLNEHPGNITGNLLMAYFMEETEDLKAALDYSKKAVEFSPTNYNLNATIAMTYKTLFDSTGDPAYKERGLYYFREALRYAPGVAKIETGLYELEHAEKD